MDAVSILFSLYCFVWGGCADVLLMFSVFIFFEGEAVVVLFVFNMIFLFWGIQVLGFRALAFSQVSCDGTGP